MGRLPFHRGSTVLLAGLLVGLAGCVRTTPPPRPPEPPPATPPPAPVTPPAPVPPPPGPANALAAGVAAGPRLDTLAFSPFVAARALAA